MLLAVCLYVKINLLQIPQHLFSEARQVVVRAEKWVQYAEVRERDRLAEQLADSRRNVCYLELRVHFPERIEVLAVERLHGKALLGVGEGHYAQLIDAHPAMLALRV
jgi:hypothetical protein